MAHALADKDYLAVINGPEDGNEFVLDTFSLYVGSDHACTAPILLDRTVQPLHARLTAVPDGFRVRALTHARTYVNGKRAGIHRSRLLRNGDTLKVGHTLLKLHCSPGGIASRSRGIIPDSDIVHFTKHVVGGTTKSTARFTFKHWRRVVFVAFVAAVLISPEFRSLLLAWIRASIDWVRSSLARALS